MPHTLRPVYDLPTFSYHGGSEVADMKAESVCNSSYYSPVESTPFETAFCAPELSYLPWNQHMDYVTGPEELRYGEMGINPISPMAAMHTISPMSSIAALNPINPITPLGVYDSYGGVFSHESSPGASLGPSPLTSPTESPNGYYTAVVTPHVPAAMLTPTPPSPEAQVPLSPVEDVGDCSASDADTDDNGLVTDTGDSSNATSCAPRRNKSRAAKCSLNHNEDYDDDDDTGHVTQTHASNGSTPTQTRHTAQPNRTPGPSTVDQLRADPHIWSLANQLKKGVYVCTQCPSGRRAAQFKTLAQLAAHFDTHNLIRPCKCDEESCPWHIVGFSTRSEQVRHMKSKHLKQRFNCGVCGRVFVRSDSLKRHYKLLHSDDEGTKGARGKRKTKVDVKWVESS